MIVYSRSAERGKPVPGIAEVVLIAGAVLAFIGISIIVHLLNQRIDELEKKRKPRDWSGSDW